MRKLLAFTVLLLAPTSLLAQGGFVRDIVLQRKTLSNPSITYAQPVNGASIRVCTGGGTPCTPLASIFTDSTLSTPKANPTASDINGNFSFWAAPGKYTVGITVSGVYTNFEYTVDVSDITDLVLDITTASHTWTMLQTFSAGISTAGISTTTETASGVITSSLAPGTAPFTIASTTGVANLRALRHPLVQFCGTTTTCSATAQTSVQVVYGSAALDNASPAIATVTGISPAFTSTATYNCVVTNNTTAANDIKVTKVSGSSFTMTGPNTVVDVISYVCSGT